MREKIKRIVCCAAAVTFVMTAAGVSGNGGLLSPNGAVVASAEVYTGSCGDNVTYTLDGGVLTISGSGYMNDYAIGRTPWFYVSDTITKVVINKGVRSVGSSAFYGMYSLKSVTVPDGIESIGEYAFNSSGITSVDLPESVTEIYDRAFGNCLSLTTVGIKSNVSYIGEEAFIGCTKLSSLDLPAKVSYIGGLAFCDTPWLAAQKNSVGIAAVNGFLLDGSDVSGNITVPDGVKTICGGAFEYCADLTGAVLPASLEYIDESAFKGCKRLAYVNFPESLSDIGSRAFAECSSLKSVSLPEGLSELSEGVFADCTSLTDVDICSVVDIAEGAFRGCTKLTSIDLPSGLSSIGANAFANCSSLADITFPEDIEYISGTAFNSTKWLERRKSESPLVIVNNILVNGTAAKGIAEIPNDIISISDHAFENNSTLREIIIPSSVLSIGDEAFIGCSSLACVSVPESVLDIGEMALGSRNDPETGAPVIDPSFVVYCAEGSSAETYCKDMGTSCKIVKYDGTNALTLVLVGTVTTPNKATISVYKKGSSEKLKDVSSDKYGNTDLSGLAEGSYDLVISYTGYAPRTVTYKTGSALGEIKLCKYGDADGDGKFGSVDISMIQKYICNWTVYPVYVEAADVNADGKISALDISLMQKKLCSWDVTFGKQ